MLWTPACDTCANVQGAGWDGCCVARGWFEGMESWSESSLRGLWEEVFLEGSKGGVAGEVWGVPHTPAIKEELWAVFWVMRQARILLHHRACGYPVFGLARGNLEGSEKGELEFWTG